VAKARLTFKTCDKKGIPLAELISVHRQFCSTHSLGDNLGDGYLCAQNPVYLNVRKACLESGYSYSQENHGHYYSFPLMSLDDVIESRRIPYRNNFAWLKILEARAPKKFTLTELKRSELQFNYLFHESAHCIAHSLFFGRTPFSRIKKNADTLMKIMVGEAFANTVEGLSAAFAEGEIGSYFLDANCHFRSNKKEVRAIRAGGKRWGFEKTTMILLLSFLYANYLRDKLGKQELARIRSLAGLEKMANISVLAKIGTELSEQFRTTTTHLHLMKLGFPSDLKRLMNQDPLARLQQPKNHSARDITWQLAKIASRGLD